jgi:hypothetical protein
MTQPDSTPNESPVSWPSRKAGREDSSWQGWSIKVVDEAGRDVFSVPVRLK